MRFMNSLHYQLYGILVACVCRTTKMEVRIMDQGRTLLEAVCYRILSMQAFIREPIVAPRAPGTGDVCCSVPS